MTSHFNQLADFILSLTSLPAYAQSKSCKAKCIQQHPFTSGISVSASSHQDLYSLIFKSCCAPGAPTDSSKDCKHSALLKVRYKVVNSRKGTTQLGGFLRKNVAPPNQEAVQGIEKQEDFRKFFLSVTLRCAEMLLRVMEYRPGSW